MTLKLVLQTALLCIVFITSTAAHKPKHFEWAKDFGLSTVQRYRSPFEQAQHHIEIERKTYNLSSEPIDVVFVCHKKDLVTLDLAIEGIKINGKNIRRIIVISEEKLTDNAEWFSEANFPFTKRDLAIEIFKPNKKSAYFFINAKNSRIGWIYQQLLKLYAPFTVPEISSNVLIVDADTIFLNETEFIDKNGITLFNPGTEFNAPYFAHANRLIPGFKKIHPYYSGISHHMVFQRPILADLFSIIESAHKTVAWKAFCWCIDQKELYGSSLSEYEIYFNFVFARTSQVAIRHLQWDNMKFDRDAIALHQDGGYHYVSCHSYCT
jgi:hypothetical protein